MGATDYLKYAKTNLNEGMELYNSDEKEKQHQANRKFETTVKFARQGKKYIQEHCKTLNGLKRRKQMNSVEETRKYLLELYEKWAKEVEKIENGKFLGKDYSNPYYISIPDNWFDSDKRIMIVGEEGYGEWGAGKQYGWKKGEPSWKINDFEKIINYNRIKILQQVAPTNLKDEEKELCGDRKSAFWKRFNSFYQICPCVWNNLDKIHSTKLREKLKYQLTKQEREELHGTEIQILSEEIKLLDPTHVVFCGWKDRDKAFELELPEVYKNFSLQKRNDTKIYSVMKDRCYIFTYHPNWRGKPKHYEESVEIIVKSISVDK